MGKCFSFLILAATSFVVWIHCLSVARSSTSAPSRRPPLLQSRQSISTSQVRVDSISIQNPPDCFQWLPESWLQNLADSCSNRPCVWAPSGTCADQGSFMDKNCFCQPFNNQTQNSIFVSSACSFGISDKAAYYHWINMTCGDMVEFQGLPSNWTSMYSSMDLVTIGGPYSNLPCVPRSCQDVPNVIFPWYKIPDCIYGCLVYRTGWFSSLLDQEQVDWANFSSNIDSMNRTIDLGLYLDRTEDDFCGSFLKTAETSCPSMCSTKLQRAEFLLWLNLTCSGAKAFAGMPSNWTDAVEAAAGDATYHNETDLVFPTCATSWCGNTLSSMKSSSSELHCILDPTMTYCIANATKVSYPHFCENIFYPLTCEGFCTKPSERYDLLTFINDTCSGITGWSGLPNNWTSLLSIVLSDLKPWPEVIRNDNTNNNPAGRALLCPSPQANIGVFAAVNVAMLLTAPLIGRRKVVEWVTFGRLGKAHGASWLYMGPLMAALQLLVNSVNALIIKRIPGYSNVDIKTLVLLWCTRPRMAWLVVILIPYQADEVMYFSCAVASLFSELILQILSSYTFGTLANFARSQGFYKLNQLDDVQYGGAAKLMYAGALLWLIVVTFCLSIITYSIVEVERMKGTFARFASSSKRQEKRGLKRARELQDTTNQAYNNLKARNNLLDVDGNDRLPGILANQSLLANSSDAMVQSLLNMTEWTQRESDYRRERTLLKKLERKGNALPETIADSKSSIEELRSWLETVSQGTIDDVTRAREAIPKQVQEVLKAKKYLPPSNSEENRMVLREWKNIGSAWSVHEKHWDKILSNWKSRSERLRNLEEKEQAALQSQRASRHVWMLAFAMDILGRFCSPVFAPRLLPTTLDHTCRQLGCFLRVWYVPGSECIEWRGKSSETFYHQR